MTELTTEGPTATVHTFTDTRIVTLRLEGAEDRRPQNRARGTWYRPERLHLRFYGIRRSEFGAALQWQTEARLNGPIRKKDLTLGVQRGEESWLWDGFENAPEYVKAVVAEYMPKEGE
ncbi:hypothetical protein ACFRAQ_34780 [Nocardia sp. NPDC056611]|uniref:hypothetical protein n=1 Tax=Nocardia sp. NPDC056611 TaxID=3345877 RepID=UPI00366C2806